MNFNNRKIKLHTVAFAISLCILPSIVSAQRNEVGLSFGGTEYFGDLNTNTSLQFTNPVAGVFDRFNFDSRISIKSQFNYTRLAASDSKATNKWQQTRNLSFFTDVMEWNNQLEFNFLDFKSSSPKFKFSPYFTAGFSVFSFDPMAEYNGNKFHLQPLGTEGQGYPEYPDRKKYKLTSTAFSVGGGMKYRLNKNWIFWCEAVNRNTHTDYLDDVSSTYADPLVLLNEGGPLVEALADRSVELGGEPVGLSGKQRGDARRRDDYLIFNIGFSFTIVKNKCPFFPHH